MKTIITLAFLTFITVTTSAVGTPGSSQPVKTTSNVNNCFKFFRAHRQGAGVAMSWATSVSNIEQFIVERSYDGEYFDAVCALGCNGTATHNFADNDVFPGVIYYRVTAVKTDGSVERSTVEAVRIVRRG